MRNVARRAGLALLVALLTIAVVELVAYVALIATGIHPRKPFDEMYVASGCLKANQYNYGKYVQGDGWKVMMGKIPHPFFGFVNNQEGETLDERRGQLGADYENPLRYSIALGRDPRPADEYTIGIFGASVAVSFADHVMRDDEFANALRARIPALAGRRIVIRNMAIGASRQPAQLAIAVHYMNLFDMTINLDGYSEQAIEMYPEYPIEFPMFGDVFFGKGGPSRYLELSSAEYLCKAISGPGRDAVLRHSNTYYLFWYVASSWLNRVSQPRPAASGDLVEEFPFTPDEVRRLYGDYYERYTRYQSQLLSANGVHAYFFLQPNQYVPNSKPFTEEERRTALGANQEEITARYAFAKEAFAKLAADGVPAYDLTGVFARENETVYVDVCCHVNARGNTLIANAMVDAIAQAENTRVAAQRR